jgi:cytoskeletal protein CcmA (bactofilin family)
MGIFSKKNKMGIDLQTISTLITEGAIIEGGLKAPAFARIDGHVKGNVTVAEGLILGETGIITGNVTTKEMVVYGTVNGTLKVESVEIKNTGKINGDIKTQSLAVETGAIYNGNLIMGNDSEEKTPPNSKKKTEVI